MGTELFASGEGGGDLTNMIRVGNVCALKEKPLRVRVEFKDKGSMTSHWLPCLVSSSLKNKVYDPYDIGEDVVCLFLPNGIQRGFVLGAYYPNNVDVPTGTVDTWSRQFADGTKIEVDRKAHVMKFVDSFGSYIEFSGGNITIKAAGNVYINP